MAKISSGILLYRHHNDSLQVFLVHPGGPFWKYKDKGAWSIPKGEAAEGEDMMKNAIRELKEETGIDITGHKLIDLGDIKQKAGKVVYAYAAEYTANGDPEIVSNTFEMEWPPRSGITQAFPEVDQGIFFSLEIAKEKINVAQVEFIDRLLQIINNKSQ